MPTKNDTKHMVAISIMASAPLSGSVHGGTCPCQWHDQNSSLSNILLEGSVAAVSYARSGNV